MPLETASFIKDLVASNPAHTDGLNQADSHMRLIKATLQATFPYFTDVALQSTQAQIDASVSVTSGGSPLPPFPVGTALLPSITFAGDPSTGWWSPGANQLAYSLGGVQQASFTPSAVVFIGGLACSAVVSVGAFSGGTGQLVPVGAVLEWYDDVLPAEGGYVWANGQIIANANTVCPILLARWGTKFGGNGTTTMGVPDRRNTVAVGKDTMGGATTRGLLPNILNSLITTIGSLFGEADHRLTVAELPTIQSSASQTINVNAPQGSFMTVTGAVESVNIIGGAGYVVASGVIGPSGSTFGNSSSASATNNIVVNSNGTNGSTHNNVQPSTTCNFILRIA